MKEKYLNKINQKHFGIPRRKIKKIAMRNIKYQKILKIKTNNYQNCKKIKYNLKLEKINYPFC